MNKKILGVLLAAIVLLVMMTTGAMAENGSTHNHCVCGATHRAIGTHTTEETKTWTAISSKDDFSKNKASGYYYLTDDIELDSTWQFTQTKEIRLCLNGHTITFTGTSGSFLSGSTVTFTLTDCQEKAGAITGFNATNGGIYVGKDFTMYNGLITGNSAKYGAGVYVDQVPGKNAIFRMYGGKITGNTASTMGGGVFVKGTFEVAGAPVVNGNANSNTSISYPSSMYKYTENIYLNAGAVQIGNGGLAEGANLNITPRFPMSSDTTPDESVTIAEGSTSDYSQYFSYTSKHEYKKQYDADTHEIQLNYVAPPPPMVTVTFDMQGHGEQIPPKNIEKEALVPKPDDPVAEGYRFVCWRDKDVYDMEWNFEYGQVYSDMTLYAIWSPIPCSVTFDANGGSGDMAVAKPIFYDDKYTLPQNSFTAPEGMCFKAWSIDGKNYQPEDEITITGNTTITAVWKKLIPTNTPSHEAKITIRPYAGKEYASVNVKLMALSSTIPEVETPLNPSANGEYLYKETIADGLYSLIITAVEENSTKPAKLTVLVDLRGHDDTKTVTLPSATQHSTVNDQSGMGIIVGNVEKVAALKEPENQGEHLEVKIITSFGYAASSIIEDGKKIEQLAAQEQKTIETKLNIDLMLLQYDADGKRTSETSLGNTNEQLLEILIPINTEGRVPNGFAVYRVHDNELQTLPYASGEEYFTVDIKGGFIRLFAKRFSSYAIGYGDPAQESTALPQTGDDSHIGLWMAMVAVSLAGCTMILVQRKRKEN